jgi:DNA-directed RNA polymerase subunit RPC12/RpoP
MNEFEKFSLRIRNNPDDLDAWKSIMAIVNDPKKKSDCQEQIDRIIAKRGASPIICPQCGGGMAVYFAGELHDKRAKCPYCGTEVDIPDSYSRTEVKTDTGFGQFLPDTKVTMFERRTDNNGAAITSDEINKLIMEKGLIAARKELEARGIQGLKISDFSRIDKSSEAYRILEEDGLKALGKSQGAIVLTPKKANSMFKGVWLVITILPIIVIIVLIIQLFKK